MFNYSFGLLKPDCLSGNLTSKVMKKITDADLQIVARKILKLTRNDVASIYYECTGHDYFEDHAKFMQSGPVMGYIVRGENAIERLNELVGYTIPSQSDNHTIRHLGTDILRNLIHSTENYAHFINETKVVFSDKELKSLCHQKKAP